MLSFVKVTVLLDLDDKKKPFEWFFCSSLSNFGIGFLFIALQGFENRIHFCFYMLIFCLLPIFIDCCCVWGNIGSTLHQSHLPTNPTDHFEHFSYFSFIFKHFINIRRYWISAQVVWTCILWVCCRSVELYPIGCIFMISQLSVFIKIGFTFVKFCLCLIPIVCMVKFWALCLICLFSVSSFFLLYYIKF